MCYKPARISVSLISSAQRCIEKGNTEQAGKLLESAKIHMGPVVNTRWDHERIGDKYNRALKALQLAKRSKPSTMRSVDW